MMRLLLDPIERLWLGDLARPGKRQARSCRSANAGVPDPNLRG
jgi:hypothetical protein